MLNPTIVVGYYTPKYREDALRLIKTLEQHNVQFYIESVEEKESWEHAVSHKPVFLLECWERFPDRSLLYVDVDAIFHSNPMQFFDVLSARNWDFAAHWFQGPNGGYNRTRNDNHFLSGTMWFGRTKNAKRILERWITFNKERQAKGNWEGGGQANLRDVLSERWVKGIEIYKLPGRFCFVFDKPWAYPDGEPRIIEHLIASRENKGKNKGKVNQARQARIEQIDNEKSDQIICQRVTNTIGTFDVLPHKERMSDRVRIDKHENPIRNVFRRYAREDAWGIDVGANLGLHTVFMGSVCHTVLAIEPHPQTFELLRRNVALNTGEYRLRNVAAGYDEGVLVVMRLMDMTTDRNIGGAYLLPQTKKTRSTVPVEIRTLDREWRDAGSPDVSIIKIDVEGFEKEVFKGMLDLVAECQPAVVVEARTNAQEMASSIGYHAELLQGFDWLMLPSEKEVGPCS